MTASPSTNGRVATGAAETASDRWIGFEAFGVPISIEVDSPVILDHVRSVLPPGWRPQENVPEDNQFKLFSKDGVTYRVQHPRQSLAGSSDLNVAIEVLDSELRAFIAFHAPAHIFVHAGVVARDGRAIVVPGPTFSGKTSLVAALLRAGAVYYSDEFAVLDAEGLVHPYPKPLSIRIRGFEQTDQDVGALGGTAGTGPVPVGSVLITQYRPGAQWRPRQISTGEGILAMLSNTIPAQERPDQALSAIRQALDGAVILESERGEAAEVAEDVLHRTHS